MELGEQKQTGVIWLLVILVLAGFAVAVMRFGRGNQELAAANQSSAVRPIPTRQVRVYTVYYGLGVFSPTNIRIHVGDSVKFQNDSGSPIRVVSDSTDGRPDLAGFDSVGDIPPKSAFTYTFSRTGIFGYHNAKNLTEEGTVIVRP
jgi:plastocyanin